MLIRKQITLFFIMLLGIVIYLYYGKEYLFLKKILKTKEYINFISDARKSEKINLITYRQYGMAANSTFELILYDKKNEVLLPHALRSPEWKDAMKNLSYYIAIDKCNFKIKKLEQDSFVLISHNC